MSLVRIAAITVIALGSCGSSPATEAGAGPEAGTPRTETTPPTRPGATVTTDRAVPLVPTSLTIRITASSYGNLQAVTSVGATCTASSILPSGGRGTSQGLQTTQVADSGGRVGWTYQRGTNTKAGTGTHTVRCGLNGQAATSSASFTLP